MLMLEPASILMLEVSRELLLQFQTGNAGLDPFSIWCTPPTGSNVLMLQGEWMSCTDTALGERV